MTPHAFKEYIKYRWYAKTRHGIHSPFVYAFIDNCLGIKSALSLEERINAYFGDVVEWMNDKIEIQSTNKLSVKAIRGIHATAQSTNQWNKLAHNTDDVIISIDLHSIGLLIYNPDIKEKQHFVLRYPL